MLDAYIKTGSFLEFLLNFEETYNKELRWEVFLHKVFDRTWDEYEEGVSEAVGRVEKSQMSETKQQETIADSMAILQSFQPTQQEVRTLGSV